MTSVAALPATRTQPTSEVTGPPVVLIHGFAAAGATDWPAERWAGPLAEAGRETVVVHLPGHAGGPAVASADEVTTARLLRRLAEGIGQDEVDVVGYSLGARLAWDLAATGALRVRRLVLGGLSPVEPFGAVDLAAARAAVQGGPQPTDMLTGIITSMVSGPGQDAESLLRLVEGLAREPFDPAARAPEAPTLFLAGKEDQMAQGIDQVVARVPGARLEHVPGDHLGALAGDELRTAVFRFLGV
ncbi:alpha/beta fold hydrolase [Saccharothrix algeriensis]|uniref:Alpha/beta fold hydrolase n=1 Tax=Saccharothrix algeriensis TaxID=173560 RepID=A0A8T8I1H6_9PSEU|nr:alpha/beta fold hydrolase [Saccharothrix algeriensis]MBM7810394.1 pimeloyl-ACP methyl ester carboxylesterase [Saccharothrix algeriensis]QTR04527.1 alpha/beta fold hydrolase [Saccharothrix algeriensis]